MGLPCVHGMLKYNLYGTTPTANLKDVAMPYSKVDSAMPQRSYSYGRISTGGRQARGTGLLRQQGRTDEADDAWPVQISSEHGWHLDEETFTDKGRSAFHKKNLGPKAALTRFLKAIKKGRVLPGSVLLLDKLDRLSRGEMDDAHDLFRDILRAGVWVCTRVPFRIYRGDKPRDFMDVMEVMWLMYLNWMESVKKQDNARGAWKDQRAKARADCTPHQALPPFWLRRTPAGYEAITEKLALARRVHEMCWQRIGARRIVGKLIAEGVPHPVPGRTWNVSFVQNQILDTRRAFGEYQPCTREGDKRLPAGEPIKGYYLPAPVTEEEFALTRLRRRENFRERGRPGTSRVNLFRGLLREATTRGRLSLHPETRGGRYQAVLAVPGVNGLRMLYEPFASYVLAAVAMLGPDDVLEPSLRSSEREKQMGELTGRETRLAARQKQLQQLVADPDRDAAAFVPALDSVSAELKALRRDRERLQQECRSNRAEALAETQSLIQCRAGKSGEELREFDEQIREALPGVVQEIWVQFQKVSARHQVVHVQLWLSEGVRYFQMLPANLHGSAVWQLDPAAGGPDLRRGYFLPG